MKKYACYATVVGTKHLGIVEAESKDDAIRKAWLLDTCYVNLCHQCDEECEGAEIDGIVAEELNKEGVES